jgi:hypothetical protein
VSVKKIFSFAYGIVLNFLNVYSLVQSIITYNLYAHNKKMKELMGSKPAMIFYIYLILLYNFCRMISSLY